ncbi:UNVERIFIED_CONTAM: hypothetical protein FKN15_015284 [Acipenser sinensis]
MAPPLLALGTAAPPLLALGTAAPPLLDHGTAAPPLLALGMAAPPLLALGMCGRSGSSLSGCGRSGSFLSGCGCSGSPSLGDGSGSPSGSRDGSSFPSGSRDSGSSPSGSQDDGSSPSGSRDGSSSPSGSRDGSSSLSGSRDDSSPLSSSRDDSSSLDWGLSLIYHQGASTSPIFPGMVVKVVMLEVVGWLPRMGFAAAPGPGCGGILPSCGHPPHSAHTSQLVAHLDRTSTDDPPSRTRNTTGRGSLGPPTGKRSRQRQQHQKLLPYQLEDPASLFPWCSWCGKGDHRWRSCPEVPPVDWCGRCEVYDHNWAGCSYALAQEEADDDWELFLKRLAAELCPGCGAYGHTVAICPTQTEGRRRRQRGRKTWEEEEWCTHCMQYGHEESQPLSSCHTVLSNKP